jgi:hypothetical protein
LLRRVVLAFAALTLAHAVASAEAVGDWPQMEPWGLNPNGSENLLLDVAVMPQTYYRRDALGSPVAGVRMAAWVNLASRSLADGKLRIVTSFRYDLDSGGARRVSGDPLYTPATPSIMTTYVEYDATSDLKLRAGRQFYTDLADYLAFDGARVMWKLPIPLQIDVYGGVRSAIAVTEGAVSSSLYELDGVPQTDVRGPQPLVGAALRWVGNMKAREEASVGFRQSWSIVTSDELKALGVPGSLTSSTQTTAQELVASAARDFDVIYVAGGLAYEVALDRLERGRLSLVFPFSRFVPVPFMEKNRRLDISADYQRYQPTFSLDSIWNFFTSYAFDEFGLGAAFHAGMLSLQLKAFERIYYSEIYDRTNKVISYSPGRQYAAGGRVTGSATISSADLLDGGVAYQNGFGGGDLFIDAGLRHRFDFPLEAYGRLSLSNWDQKVISVNAGTSFSIVAGATYHFPYGASASLILEEAIAGVASGTTLYTSPVPRVFAVVDFARWL